MKYDEVVEFQYRRDTSDDFTVLPVWCAIEHTGAASFTGDNRLIVADSYVLTCRYESVSADFRDFIDEGSRAFNGGRVGVGSDLFSQVVVRNKLCLIGSVTESGDREKEVAFVVTNTRGG